MCGCVFTVRICWHRPKDGAAFICHMHYRNAYGNRRSVCASVCILIMVKWFELRSHPVCVCVCVVLTVVFRQLYIYSFRMVNSSAHKHTHAHCHTSHINSLHFIIIEYLFMLENKSVGLMRMKCSPTTEKYKHQRLTTCNKYSSQSKLA